MRPSADQAEQLPLLGDAHNAANQRTIKRQKIAAVVLVFTLISIVAVGGSIIGTSANKLIEWNICRDKYPDRVVDDPRCGDREIAGRFAYIDGLLTTFQKLPGILCGIPYGLVADRWGRRRSLTLCMFGLTMMMVHIVTVLTLAESHHLDLRWIWACGLWMMIGGGFPVLNSTIFAVLNDVATPETRATMFFYYGTCHVVGSIIAPPITYVVIRFGAWNTLVLSTAFLGLTIPVAACLPETKDFQHAKPVVAEETTTVTKGTVDRVKKLCIEGVALVRYQFWENKLLGLSLFSLIFTSVGKSFTNVLQLYAKTLFHWEWEEVGFIASVQNFMALSMTAVLLPSIDYYLRKVLKLSLLHKDIWLVRGSILFMVVGAAAIGLAPTAPIFFASLVLFGFSGGYEYAIRGMLAQAAGDRVATLYAVIAVMEEIGQASSGPVYSYLFNAGLKLGGAMISLPFFVASLLFSIAGIIVWLVRWQTLEESEEGQDNDTLYDQDI